MGGFNGATLGRAWKLADTHTPHRPTAVRFNGATLGRAWKHGGFVVVGERYDKLQWGHAR